MGHRHHTHTRTRVVVVLLLVLVSIAAACQATAELTLVHDGAAIDAPVDLRQTRAESRTRIDLDLTRSDVECTQRAINRYPEVPVLTAHVVVDGVLGAPCFGPIDERLVDAWTVLTEITPRDELRSIAVFSGFVSNEAGRTTLAYVNPLGVPAVNFQMAVNMTEAALDPTELRLTVAHEFAHVMTTRPSQIDPSIRPRDCETWHNLRGCFTQDSIMWHWVRDFWGDGLIHEINPKIEPTIDSGAARCSLHSGFFGPYGASHPEEDFAEAFSAFVFQIEPTSNGQRDRLEWMANRPELLRFRNHAIESDLDAMQYGFSPCG